MKMVSENHPTLGLAMIMKDEVDDLDRIIRDYGKYFDKIYVTVTDKKTYTRLLKKNLQNPTMSRELELSYFKWIDHFGKARRYNQQRIKTDYWMWIDLDDEIEGADKLYQVIEYMESKNLDTVIFQYDYVRQVRLLDPENILWRERIIKSSSKLQWRNEPIHESVNIQSDTKKEVLSQVIVKHRRTMGQMSTSVERNRLILEKEWRRKHRTLTAWHLGATLRESGDYDGAIEKFLFLAEHSANKEFRFMAWQSLCECYYQTSRYPEALNAISECMAIDSDHPSPWYQGFAVFRATAHYDLAMQSAEIALIKRAEGSRVAIMGDDPSWYQYKGPFTIAQAYLSIGNVERAYELYREVKKVAPQYIEELSLETETEWDAVFEQAYSNRSTTD